jgi:hypothetical protein
VQEPAARSGSRFLAKFAASTAGVEDVTHGGGIKAGTGAQNNPSISVYTSAERAAASEFRRVHKRKRNAPEGRDKMVHCGRGGLYAPYASCTIGSSCLRRLASIARCSWSIGKSS